MKRLHPRNALSSLLCQQVGDEDCDMAVKTIKILVQQGQADLHSMHPSSLILNWGTSINFCEYLFKQDMAEVGLVDTNHRLGVWLHCMLTNLEVTSSEGCKSMIRRLVAKGADIHTPYRGRRTPLDSLFMFGKEPWKSQYLADQWLEVLCSAGIDLDRYLRRETRLHPKKPHRTLDYDGNRRQLKLLSYEPPIVR